MNYQVPTQSLGDYLEAFTMIELVIVTAIDYENLNENVTPKDVGVAVK